MRLARGMGGIALAALGVAGPLGAQVNERAAGRVVRVVGSDTVPVPEARVTLHRVTPAVQGPVDSAITTGSGGFRFRFRADTSAVYLLSAGHAGIEHFSPPLNLDPAHPDTGLVLVVSDTSSRAPVRVASRHLVIGRPGRDGTRATLEILVLENPGTFTRVSSSDTVPTWGARLPKGVVGFQVGQGDASGDALLSRHDSVLLLAPVAPGEKQLLYTYLFPAAPGTVRLPVGDSIAEVTILLEEFDRTVTGAGIVRGDSQLIERRSFRRWAGPVPAGVEITIDFPGNSTRWILPALVSALALVLVLALARTLRSPAIARKAGTGAGLDALARLDARYAGREREVAPVEWAEYLAERARLKSEVAARLARPRPLP